MYVTITSLRLRNPFKFFLLSLLAMKIVRQLKENPDCIGYKNTGFWTLHFTMSQWKDEKALRAFAVQGQHLAAMKRSRELAIEIRTYSFPADQMPDWKTAQALLLEKGRLITY